MSSADPSARAVKPMKVQEPVFLGVIWGGLAIASICCCLRFLARVQTFKKLLADDYFVVFALVLVIANAIIWQIYADNMYYTMRVAAGLELPGGDFASISEPYFKSTAAVIILFYTSLWSIKISFLLFFRRLGTNVKYQKFIWWPIFGITVATYFACIGTIQYSCLLRSFQYLAAHCATPPATTFQQVTLKLNCTWDVLTDFLIMSIPFTMLWGVQMRWRRKAALAGIFSLVVITMVFAIVRTAVVGSSTTTLPDSSWLYLWSSIEVSVAIIVACLASFRNLFSAQPQTKRYEPPTGPSGSNKWLQGSKPRSKLRQLIDTIASSSEETQSTYQVQIESGKHSASTSATRTDSRDEMPLQKATHVHVRSEVDLVNEPAGV